MFNDFELTNQGVTLLNRVQAGEGTLQFTKYEIGEGVISGTVKDLTQLVTPFHNFEITRIIRTDDLSTRVQGYFNNTTFVTSHEFRECGIYAQIPGDPTDVLYSYCFDTDPETIPDSSTPYNLTLDDRTYTSDVDNISLEIVEAKDRYDFDTVSDMTLATYIVEGDRIKLWGYYELGDGGGHERIFSLTDNGTGISFNGGFAIIPDGERRFNPKWFGAIGDNIADDYQSIQSMFTYIQSKGGGTISVPNGIYGLSNQVEIGGNIKWDNGKDTSFVRKHNENMFVNSLDTSAATSGYYGGNGNIEINNGIFEGNGVNFYDPFNCFEIGYGNNIVFNNVTVKDIVYAHGVDLAACKDVKFINCKFLGYSDSTGGSRGYVEAIQLDPNLPTSFSFGARDGTHSRDILIDGCYFGANIDNTDPRFTAFPAGVGNHYTANNRFIENVNVTNCIFAGTTYAGVNVFKWNNIIISNNNFINIPNTALGIRVDNVSNAMASSQNPDGSPSGQPQGGSSLNISSNIFDGGEKGIEIAGRVNDGGGNIILYGVQEEVIISNNIFKGISSSNIECLWVDRLNISSNIANSGSRFSAIRNCRNVEISNNEGDTFSFDGIFSETIATDDVSLANINNSEFQSFWNINSNTFTDIQLWGILVQNVFNSSVTGNFITNPSQQDNTRGGVQIANSSVKGFITSNFITYNSSGTTADLGVSGTASCTKVIIGNNYAEANITPYENLSIGGLNLNADYV